MFQPRTCWAMMVALPLFSAPALAADSAGLKALKEEIARMRNSYESRINALEQRLAQAETTAGKAQNQASEAAQAASSATATAQAASVAATARPSNEAAFNPAVSLILSGMYNNIKANANNRPYAINGFVPSNGEVAPPARGFNLGESELVVESNIDSYFRGKMVLAIPPEEGASPTVEEGFIQTLGLSNGFNLKAGRFFSGVGYINEQHAHAWDFSDAPLAYKAFFGGQMKGEGVQLKWLAPTDTFLEFGVEGGKGGSFPSTNRNKNGFTTGSVFAHVGGDVGIEHSWRAGLSFVGSKPQGRSYDDSDANGVATANTFSGTSKTWIADGVWKWAPNGDPSQRYLKVQGEYFRRQENGTLTCADKDTANASNCTGGISDSLDSRQSGWYAQAVYKFAPTWRTGYRYDRLDYGNVNLGANLNSADLPILARHDPSRNTVMVDWSPSEFSLIRLQYARDKSRSGEADNQIWLHYIVSLGAHGAHKY
ncbi:TonB-dependent receptor [Denitratisoma sp. agr-D3]